MKAVSDLPLERRFYLARLLGALALAVEGRAAVLLGELGLPDAVPDPALADPALARAIEALAVDCFRSSLGPPSPYADDEAET